MWDHWVYIGKTVRGVTCGKYEEVMLRAGWYEVLPEGASLNRWQCMFSIKDDVEPIPHQDLEPEATM